jgi:hypothetical protein
MMMKIRIITGLMLVLIASSSALIAAELEEVKVTAGTGSHGVRDGEEAQFNLPTGVFAAADGSIIVADTQNNLIRRITAGITERISGHIMVMGESRFPQGFHFDGDISEALFNHPADGIVDAQGRMFIVDSVNNAIRLIDGNKVSTFARGLNHPTAIAMDKEGNLIVADTLNHAIRKISPNGRITTVAGRVGVAGRADGLAEFALLNSPMGVAVANDGTIFVADSGNHLIRSVRNGIVETVAGTWLFPSQVEWQSDEGEWDIIPIGGHADGFENTMFNLPQGLAMWGDVLIVADNANNHIRAVFPSGEVVTIAGTGYPEFSEGEPLAAGLNSPANVLVVGDVLYIVDTGNNMIREFNLRSVIAP